MAYTIGVLDIIHILQSMLSQNELHVTKSYRNTNHTLFLFNGTCMGLLVINECV